VGKRSRPCPGRKDECLVRKRSTRAQAHDALRAMDGNRRIGAMDGDASIGKPFLWTMRLQGLSSVFEERLRKRRAVIGQLRLIAYEVHGARAASGRERAAQLSGSVAAADDDDARTHRNL
jgi:hypothetical protein